jgi:hypothetical protein
MKYLCKLRYTTATVGARAYASEALAAFERSDKTIRFI